MTTAHRPTWAPAKGGEEQGGMRFYAPSQMKSVKDIAGFTKMKYRQDGQSNLNDLTKRNVKSLLEEREKEHFSKLSREEFISEREKDMKLLEDISEDKMCIIPEEVDADEEDSTGSDDSSDEETDEEAELLAELERIKQERYAEAARAEASARAKEDEKLRAEVSAGNPLLNDTLAGHSDFRIKRRWDDDVVFRNQAAKEPIKQRRFINDTIRNDFHRRFLDRYMK